MIVGSGASRFAQLIAYRPDAACAGCRIGEDHRVRLVLVLEEVVDAEFLEKAVKKSKSVSLYCTQ
jgi:hypothetical protein